MTPMLLCQIPSAFSDLFNKSWLAIYPTIRKLKTPLLSIAISDRSSPNIASNATARTLSNGKVNCG